MKLSTWLVVAVASVAPASAYAVGRPVPMAPACHAACSPCHRVAPRAAVVARNDEQPAPLWRRALRSPWRSLLSAAAIGSAAIVLRPGGPPPALAAVKTAPSSKTIKKQPKSGAATLPTIALMGGFAWYSFASAAKEDEEETVRIKDETEKLEKLSKEFTDIEDGVTVDEDIMASLRKRIGNSTEDGGEGGDENGPSAGLDGDGPDDGSGGGGGGGQPPPVGSDSGGGAAVLEPPSDSPSAAAGDEPATPSPEEVARLDRLFGSPDAEK